MIIILFYPTSYNQMALCLDFWSSNVDSGSLNIVNSSKLVIKWSFLAMKCYIRGQALEVLILTQIQVIWKFSSEFQKQ